MKAKPLPYHDVDLQVKVVNAQVELRGWVGYPNDARAAAETAREFGGVKRVLSHLRSWPATDNYRL